MYNIHMNKSDLAYKIYNNSGIGDEWPIDKKVLARYLFDEIEVGVNFITYEEIGCVVVKSQEDRASITFIAVEKEFQGKGVGKKLLEETERECRDEGIDTLYIGHKIGSYLWPGAPSKSDSHKFFRSQGFESRPDPYAWDLVLDLADFENEEDYDSDINKKGYKMGFLKEGDTQELLKFEEENFGFWYDWYSTLISKGRIERILSVKNSNDEIVGATALSWGDYKFQKLLDGVVGYGSMLGVRESDRKNGVGQALKLKGMEVLKNNGVETVVVQYTTVPEFYKKLGFKEWKKYHMLQKRLG